MIKIFSSFLALWMLLYFVSAVPSALAQRGPSLIRDTEIENTIRAYSTPLFRAAGLSPDAVEIHIVNDKQINAFVAGGQHLFIHTGLLMKAEDPREVIGVIAHETGHIAGGHLILMDEAISNASAIQIITMVLAAAAGVASGRGDVGQAIASSGLAEKTFFQFSRQQETEADVTALKLLERTGQSAKGLWRVTKRLEDQELISAANQDLYVRTHPINQKRIETIEAHMARSDFADKPASPDLVRRHDRMRAKLSGFLNPPFRTLQQYPPSDNSVPARYARAIMYLRMPDFEKGLPEIDGLIAEQPNDPYFREVKGQLLYENGRLQDSLDPLAQAVQLKPDAPQLRILYARALVDTNNPENLAIAEQHLKKALQLEKQNAFGWRLLGIIYGRQGNRGQSMLALAESAYYRGEYPEAIFRSKEAQDALKRGSPGWYRASDLSRDAKRLLKKQREESTP